MTVQSMQLNDLARERLEVLRAKAIEGELSEEERREYDAFIEAVDLLAILRATSRRQHKSK